MESWAVLSLKQCFLMQCSTLHYITLIINKCFYNTPIKKNEISVASSFILRTVSAQVRLDIFHMRSCAVLSSVAMSSLTAVFNFLVTVNPLCLKRLWHHHSACTFLPLYLFHAAASFPSVSFCEAPGFCLFLIHVVALCPSLLYHLYSEKFNWEETEHQPPSVFLGQVQNEIQ